MSESIAIVGKSVKLYKGHYTKFSPDLKNIPDGITRHEATERDRAINGISRTEFGWHSINDLRTFECEELCDIPSRGVSSDHFGCRYIHSHLDSERKVPVHIDGAIRMYSSEKMLQRLESDLKKAGRDTEYTKLWRVDGALPIEKWKELVTHYYRDNRLPGEYFDGVDKNVVLTPVTPKAEHSVVDRLCVNMQKGQDVRVSISYHRIDDDFPIGRSFQTFDTITRDSTLHFIEGDSIELVKAIRRSGGNVILPKNVLWVLFKEKILNFPLIMHKGENCLKLMKGTQAALLELCKAWIKRGDDRLVAYTLGISYKEQEVWCSVAGQVEDVARWLEGKEAEFPKTENELEQWCEKINNRLTDGRPPADDMPPLDRLLKITGVLHFDRTFLDPEDFKFDTDDKGLLCSISKTIAPEIMDSLEHGELSTAIAMSVESNCSKCKGVYRDCLCSKFLDEDVVQVIHDADPLGVFYTNRPA